MPARVNLYESEFDTLIKDRGIDAEWEQAVVCNCVSRDSGQPDFTCPICGGSGYRYLKPVQTRIAVTSLTGSYKMETLELREPGTAYITPKSSVIMGYHDRVRFPDFRCKFSEVLHWSNADGKGISPQTYRNIKKVLFLADDQYEYEEGTDFEVTEDGYHLRWLNHDMLDQLDGKNLSLLYYTTPSYLVIDLLHELRGTFSDRKSPTETFRELPKQYKLQREDFMYKVNTPEPVEPADKEPEPPKQSPYEWDDEGVSI